MRAKAAPARSRPAAVCRGGTSSPRCPVGAGGRSRGTRASAIVRDAFGEYSPPLGGLVDRALDEQWIDAEPARRQGAAARSACRSSATARCVLLNWSRQRRLGADDWPTSSATPTTTRTLADRTPLQRRLPMALAETASIFCETLVVEAGLAPPRRRRAAGAARRRPAGREPGRRRHPQPVPVRDRGVRPPPAAHARRRASSTS